MHTYVNYVLKLFNNQTVLLQGDIHQFSDQKTRR